MTNREVIRIVQIDQPLCARRYGDGFQSPTGGCTAQLGVTGTRKCSNTKFTCQDPAAYSPGTLTLSFSEPQNDLALYYDNVIPSILNLDTTPGQINLGGMNRSASALGQREVVSITFTDHQYSDLLVDPYRLERATGEAQTEEDTHLLLDGGQGCASTPNSIASSITGDLTLMVDVAIDEVVTSPTTTQTLLSKWFTLLGANARSFTFDVTDGRLRLLASVTGTSGTTTTFVSTALVPASNVERLKYLVTLDLDTGSSPSQSRARFFHRSSDGDAWTQLGSDVTASALAQIDDNNSQIIVGARNLVFDGVAGKVFRAEVRSGVNGSIVVVFDPVGQESLTPSFTSETGEVWTVNGTASIVADPGAYDPYTRGTFWGKWIARNPFHSGYLLRVYEGNFGDALEDMRVRHYVIDKIDGPANGSVKLTAKDFFSVIEREKAVAPAASRGELEVNLAIGGGSFTVIPAGIGSAYPASGYVNIGDEIIQFTRSGDTFTVVLRGALNTEADAHEAEDLVQLVLVYTTRSAVDIVFDLLCNYTSLGDAGSPTSSPFIDFAAWTAAASSLTELYTASIATPTPVEDLLAELAEQAGFSVWPDVRTGMIEFRALRASSSITDFDDDDIVNNSFSRKEKTEERASQVWVYYAQINPVEDLEEKRNFRSRFVSIDLDSEDSTEYGNPAIKEFFSRWIPQFGRSLAERVADRHLAMFRDPPHEARFKLHVDREDDVQLAGYINVSTADIQDDTGDLLQQQVAIIAIERDEHEIEVTARTVTFEDPFDAGEERIIHIENDAFNLNLRTIHDLIYSDPEVASPSLVVQFVIDPGVIVGSTSTGAPALTTGSWPAGVTITLTNEGRIQGRGGDAGVGGYTIRFAAANGLPGQDGGTALQVTVPMRLHNDVGQIWGGGGGGGGGGAAVTFVDGVLFMGGGGGGGGGGAGTNGGNAASGGVSAVDENFNGSAGTAGSSSTGGAGGAGGSGTFEVEVVAGGAGGNGGGPGLAGQTGTSGTGDFSTGSGGSGGAAGRYIDGIAFVTWTGSPPSANGDIKGNVA